MRGKDDEFAEFDMTEDEFDRRMADGQPVQIVNMPAWLLRPPAGLYTLVTEPTATYSGSEQLTACATYPVASDINTHAVSQTMEPIGS